MHLDDNEFQDTLIEIQRYGADAVEWLKRWDSGRSVWTIEMGGLGPGYEQGIHVLCAEVLRVWIDQKIDATKWTEADEWKKAHEIADKHCIALPAIDALCLSGAQWGAAINIAHHLYKRGPRNVMADPEVKDRHIQVSKGFSVAA